MRTFIQISATGLTLVATLLWLKDWLRLTCYNIVKKADRLARLDDNKVIAKELVGQGATGRVVFGVMLLAFIFQFLEPSIKLSWDNINLCSEEFRWAIVFCIFIFMLAWITDYIMYTRMLKKVYADIDNKEISHP